MRRDEIDPEKLYHPRVLAELVGTTMSGMMCRLCRDPERYAAVRVPGERGWFIPGTTLLRYFAPRSAPAVPSTPATRRVRGTDAAAIARAESLV